MAPRTRERLYLLAVALCGVLFAAEILGRAAGPGPAPALVLGAPAPGEGEPRDVDVERLRWLLRHRYLSDREALFARPVRPAEPAEEPPPAPGEEAPEPGDD